MSYHILSDEGARELAAAIVQGVCKDYVRAKRRVMRATRPETKRRAEFDVFALERWFKSGYGEILCDQDPTTLMHKLDEIARQEWRSLE